MFIHYGSTLCGDSFEKPLGFAFIMSGEGFDEDDIIVRL